MKAKNLITIIGRGHSGTRAISHTLSASGVFMGAPINGSGDLVPPEDMYEACRVLGEHVEWLGDSKWDFSKLHKMPIPAKFSGLIDSYLKSVLTSDAENRGWKIPETTLVYPWIVRMFPEMKYIFWIRNPRDCIIGGHVTDDLDHFNIRSENPTDERLRRAVSWKYQYDLVKATPKAANWIEVKFEDFVLKQDQTLARIGDFLGIKLAKVPVRPESLDRWKTDTGVNYYDFFEPAMREYGYEIPAIKG